MPDKFQVLVTDGRGVLEVNTFTKGISGYEEALEYVKDRYRRAGQLAGLTIDISSFRHWQKDRLINRWVSI